MTWSYYANGKLMISGEYLVLEGAHSLVLPLKVGQQMKVETMNNSRDSVIKWQADEMKVAWFSADIHCSDWTISRSTNHKTAQQLVQLLEVLGTMNRTLFSANRSYIITTETGFNMNWGFGSSAALIANLAKWAEVDPFEFYFRVSQGSGADLAAALSPCPVLYRLHDSKPVIKPVKFRPKFSNHIWFIYLGCKQNTKLSVNNFLAGHQMPSKHLESINRLTEIMMQTDNPEIFKNAIREHELLMSEILGTIRVTEYRFPDFQGEIKSLGAWGGDFIMAVSVEDEAVVRSYFRGKGLDVILSFDEIVL